MTLTILFAATPALWEEYRAPLATACEAAEKNASDICGNPVANMWCTHRPKDRNPVPTAASTIQA